MDAVKVDPDAPDNLEKGCHPAAQPLHIQICQSCSTHSERRRRSRIGCRWIAFGIMAMTWTVFSYVRHASYNPPPRVWRWGDHGMPRPDKDIECVGGTNWTTYYDQPPWSPEHPYGAETAFSLPLDSDALFLISRGMFQHGVVNVEQSTEVSDMVDVRVRVAYYHDKLLEHASVCQIERADSENGVGIFTPKIAHHPPHHRLKDGLEFDVTVTLPAVDGGPLSVKKLTTELPDYSQNVANLGESVLFDEITLSSANGRISVQSVTSEVGRFSSANGEIDGEFNAQSLLDLNVVNGHITPTINLAHRKGADPPHLALHAVNGQIHAEIALTSDTPVGGEFEVEAQATNGNVGLKFTDSPVDSVLKCLVETTVGSIQVELHSAFEGTYSLENLLGAKLVSQHDVEDPAGRGRRRTVSVHEAHRRVEGELRWVESDGSSSAYEGHVTLKSVTSAIKLLV